MKSSFVFYSEWAEQIAIIADAEGGVGVTALFNAIQEYLAEDIEPGDLSPIVRLVFNQIRNQLNRDKAKYDRTVEQRKKAIEKRWQKPDTNAYETIRNDTDKGVRSKDKGLKDDDKGVEKEVEGSPNGDNTLSSTAVPAANVCVLPAPQFVAETDPKRLTDKGLEEEFNALWILYPRKEGRKDALRHYKAARREGVTYDAVEAGIIRYTNHVRDADLKYIATGSTWFNGRRWEDVYARHGPSGPQPGSLEWLAQIANGGGA